MYLRLRWLAQRCNHFFVLVNYGPGRDPVHIYSSQFSLFFAERVLLNSTISLNNADVTLSDADEVVRSMRLGTRPGARM